MALPEDVTIKDVLNKLYDKDHYLSQVFGKMNAVRNEHSSAVVRIGTTGSGVSPHYRVDPGLFLEASLIYRDRDLFMSHFVAYHGRSHERLSWGFDELRSDSWSTAETTFDEVTELLAQVRGLRR